MEVDSKEPFGELINEENLIEKENKDFSQKCKVIASIIIILLILLIIIIVILSINQEKEKEKGKENNEIEEVKPSDEVYPHISCKYNVLNHSESLAIISDEFS